MSWTVSSVMTKDVVTASRDTPYKAIAELMRERRVSALPVVDDRRRVLGVVSEADLMLKEERPITRLGGRLLDPHGDAARADARNAAALMTSPAVTVSADATLSMAARVMHKHHVKRLPVVDGDGILVGLISRADVLMVFVRSDESIANEVRDDVLLRTLAIDPGAVDVIVREGVVQLAGRLETRSLARIVARLVAGVEGVVGVDDQLRWRLDDTDLQPDSPPQATRLAASERE